MKFSSLKQQSKRTAVFFGRKVITFYLFIFVISLFFYDYSEVKSKFKIETLNRLRPRTYAYLIKFIDGKGEVDEKELKSFIRYYEHVVDYMPHNAGVYAMLGFCHAKLKNTDTAISHYREAVRLKPDVFWYNFNLGYLYFQKGQFPSAIVSFNRAVTTNPDNNLAHMLASKSYWPLLSEYKIESTTFVIDRIKKGHRNSYLLSCLSFKHLSDYEEMFKTAAFAIDLGIKEDIFYYLAGLAAYRLGKYEIAVHYFNESIEKNKNNSEALYYLSLSLKNLGKKEESAKVMEASYKVKDKRDPVKEILEKMDIQIF